MLLSQITLQERLTKYICNTFCPPPSTVHNQLHPKTTINQKLSQITAKLPPQLQSSFCWHIYVEFPAPGLLLTLLTYVIDLVGQLYNLLTPIMKSQNHQTFRKNLVFVQFSPGKLLSGFTSAPDITNAPFFAQFARNIMINIDCDCHINHFIKTPSCPLSLQSSLPRYLLQPSLRHRRWGKKSPAWWSVIASCHVA